jgi:DNA invertase Pin-like site-specific DNA recombinase
MSPLNRAVGYVRVSTPAQAKEGESLAPQRGEVPARLVKRQARAYSYIRFSTPEQEKGDSFRRQTEWAQKWADDHGYILDDKLRLADKGLSAFHGIHRDRGALGEFYHLVEQGKIEPGSALLVESLDRLSREQVPDALILFLQNLINAGITVVTLADGMEYNRESINANFGQLIMSLVIMARAHDESKMKSFRGKEAWEQKRTAARNGRKLTAKCPAWLRPTDSGFEVIPEAALAINRIFEKRLAGKGTARITQEMNQNGDWKPAKGWRESYINKILHDNRALLGEFQPRSKGFPHGEPIPGYFPAIIKPGLFNRVQAAIRRNREESGNAGGRTGAINSLFAHLAKCAYCGGPLAYASHGKPPKGGRSYLVCDKARRGLGCKKSHIRYDKFEKLILTYCKGLDPAEILPDSDRVQTELSMLRNQLQALEEEIAQAGRKVTNLIDSLSETDSPEVAIPIKKRIGELQGRKSELEARREVLASQITKINETAQDTERQLQSIRELIDRMGELEGQERIDLRLNLRSQLRRLIAQINFLPDENQIGMIFRTGERRLLIMDGDKIRLLDIVPDALRVPTQLWKKPWRLNRS